MLALATAGATAAGSAADATGVATAQDGGVDVDVTLVEGSTGEDGAVSPDTDSVTVAAEVQTGAGVDADEVDVEWSTDDAVDAERLDASDDGRRLTYAVTDEDAGETLGFEATASADGASDSDVLPVSVEGESGDGQPPTADLRYFDGPDAETVEVDASVDEINFTAFESTDSEDSFAELAYDWQVGDGAAGEIAGLSELGSDDYPADFFARYDVAEADAGGEFEVRLTVTDSDGRSDTDTTTVRVAGDGSGDESDGSDDGQSSGFSSGSSGEPSFEVAVADAPNAVEAGATADLTVRVENVGEADGETDLEVALGQSESTLRDLSVAEGSSRQVDVALTAPSEPEEYELTVGAEDAEQRRTVLVQPDESSGASEGDASASDDGSGGTGAGEPARASASGYGDADGIYWGRLLGVVFLVSLLGVGLRRGVRRVVAE